MAEASTIGLDIAKPVSQAHGADATGRVVFRKRLVRAEVLEFFAAQPPCVVALEVLSAFAPNLTARAAKRAQATRHRGLRARRRHGGGGAGDGGRREPQMQRFKPPGWVQRSLSAHAMICGHFRPRRRLMTAARYRRARAEAFRVWREETCIRTAA